MNYDEFSFFNLQLAGMLRDGLPLEGALRRVARSMQRGPMRSECEKLQADLAAGVPLSEAVARRKLPPFYVRMIQVGARSGDFPAVLTLLADYYQRTNLIWTRLKGLMVYPLILFGCSVLLSCWFAFLYSHVSEVTFRPLNEMSGAYRSGRRAAPPEAQRLILALNLWAPPLIFMGVFGTLGWIWLHPGIRRRARWRMPAFRDASLANFAAAMHLLLKGGSRLEEALDLMAMIEAGSPAGRDVKEWQKRCSEGYGRFQDIADGSRVFPPLFMWLVGGTGEDLALGFKHAAEVYQARAASRSEMLLYAALPAALIFIGALIAAQVYPFMSSMYWRLQSVFQLRDLL